MKIVIISDTHGRHEELGRLSGDVLIHCGDMENLFEAQTDALARMDDWFGRQAFDHILFVGGNHDAALEDRLLEGDQPLRNATCLTNGTVVVNGVTFHGAPWVPELAHHAFYANDRDLKTAWAHIPADVDVLITHTPPRGVLDVSGRGQSLGCRHLARRLRSLKPALHCFGHVHASAGHVVQGDTTFVNATSVNSSFKIAHRPFVFDLQGPAPKARGLTGPRLKLF